MSIQIFNMEGRVRPLSRGSTTRFTMEEAVREANTHQSLIVPNPFADKTLSESIFRRADGRDPQYVNPLTAYVGPDRSFREANPLEHGAYVNYLDPITGIMYRFPVPEEFRDKRNCLLAVCQGFTRDMKPIFEIQALTPSIKEIIIADQSLIGLIENFPKASGWHPTETEFGIPVDVTVTSDNEKSVRYLRRVREQRVGFILRGATNALSVSEVNIAEADGKFDVMVVV